MNIYKLRNQFGYTATSIIRFACHSISTLKKNKTFTENVIIPATKPIRHFIFTKYNQKNKILHLLKKKYTPISKPIPNRLPNPNHHKLPATILY